MALNSHGHHTEVCQYGTRHRGCKCPGGGRTIVPIECPRPDECAVKVGDMYAPKHRRNVAPDSPPT